MRVQKKYSGIVIPSVTPLTNSYSLDESAVEKIFDHFRKHRVSPFILGTTGEAASMPLELRQKYIRLAGKIKKTGDVLYAGISSNCLSESRDLARFCFDAGIDVVVATLPGYYALSEDEMLHYFEQLATGIKGPLIIYNIPATIHMSIPLEVIDKLSHHENIVGTKDSERSDERLRSSLERWSGRSDFSHFLGWAALSADALKNGSDGLVPSTGNFYPQVYEQMMDAVQKGENEKLNDLQNLSDLLGNIYQSGRTLGRSLWALKVLMQEAGLCRHFVMPPLSEGNEAEAGDLVNQLREIIKKERSY